MLEVGLNPNTETPLAALAEFAAQPFASTAQALDATFTLLRSLLGMRTLFLARISRDDGIFQVVAAYNDPDGCALPAGFEAPLEHAF